MTDKRKLQQYRSLPLMQWRDLLEGFAAAFILAFTFRAFVAEAYVIPTGSMAHGLQGTHMDHHCPKCDFQYRSGASEENDGKGQIIATSCPQCGFLDVLDKANEVNERSFTGDRILVNKFAYSFNDPKRWDVIVFKFPYEATTNYIKRLVGLPNEEILLANGDVYTRPLDNPHAVMTIARKPEGKQLAMMQLVHDTQYRSAELDEVMWPQPWRMVGKYQTRYHPSEHEGKPGYWLPSAKGFKVTIDGSRKDEAIGLRYHHQIPNANFWVDYNQLRVRAELEEQKGNAEIAKQVRDAMRVRWWPLPKLITDSYAYNSVIMDDVVYFGKELFSSWDQAVPAASDSEEDELAAFLSNFRAHMEGNQVIGSGERDQLTKLLKVSWPPPRNRGQYWVGDLAVEFDIEIFNSTGKVGFDIVEAGVYYQGQIEVATGKLTLSIDGGEKGFNGAGVEKPSIEGTTKLVGAGQYQIRFSNFDNELKVWVDGELVELSIPARFDTDKILSPKWSPDDPGDLLPAGISSQGVAMRIDNARVYRDVYYVASNQEALKTGVEYDHWNMDDLKRYENAIRVVEKAWLDVEDWNSVHIPRMAALQLRLDLFQAWNQTDFFTSRATVQFVVREDEFMPLGDNSPASSDARGWYSRLGKNTFHRSLLIGEALMIYWPHPWYLDLGGNAIPAIPNFRQIKVIQ